MLRLYWLLRDLLKVTYNGKKYLNFTVELKSNEYKTVSEKYEYQENQIEIYNLSRDSNQLLISAIHGLAHHINYIKNKDTYHDKEFYKIYAKLIKCCLNDKIIKESDLQNNIRQDMQNLLIELEKSHDHNIKMIDFSEKRYVFLKSVYHKHNILKKEGFLWEPTEKRWYKEFNKKDISKIRKFLKKERILNNAIIEPKEKFSILPIYKFYVVGGYRIKKELKEKGFHWDGDNKIWTKNIIAKNYNIEKKYAKQNNLEYGLM